MVLVASRQGILAGQEHEEDFLGTGNVLFAEICSYLTVFNNSNCKKLIHFHDHKNESNKSSRNK